ncbi:hypothetical protein E2C01_075799 [Portunus trituberculatus]|uniref:Uncharacterized protein n=1 Tax=Portunus trituberculatus TaxID=210409 RepID=A0A5B7IFW4_PORTR|nr:hypothetical protein [Portunus trituberculatus]
MAFIIANTRAGERTAHSPTLINVPHLCLRPLHLVAWMHHERSGQPLTLCRLPLNTGGDESVS